MAALPIPIDVTALQMNVRPQRTELSDTNEDSSAQPVESAAQPVASHVPPPEAAVNIVIQTGQSSPQQAPQEIPDPTSTPEVIASVPVPIVSAAVTIPSSTPESDRKKSAAAPGSEPQPVAAADPPVNGAPAKAEQHTETKAEAPRPVSAVQEPVAPEKAPPAQVKSLSLEFAPDGARDVRVRIAEHAGEVHVSLHSSDPGVARDLRSGAADLGTTLTQAGYDAQTWTSGRQHQQNQQQRRDDSQSARASANKTTEAFDGLMTESTENL